MARRSDKKQQKRLSVKKAVRTDRKSSTWIVKTSPGANPKELSVALSFLLRDILGLAKTIKEAKALLNSGKIMVNGKARKDTNFAIGLFDVIELEKEGKNHFYRILIDYKGRIIASEVKDGKDLVKICKVSDKRIIKGKKVQLTTSDGIVLREPKEDANVNDSLKIKFPEKKVLEVIEMKKENVAYLTSGKNAGKVAKIMDISEGTIKREKLVTLDDNGKKIMTVITKVIVVGKGKPEIELGVEE